MSEFRVDNELDCVPADDTEVIYKVAGFLGQLVDFETPGFGIIHNASVPASHDSVHDLHADLIKKAAEILVPSLIVSDQFSSPSNRSFKDLTGFHRDCVNPPLEPDYSQRMILRLHTADQLSGAFVVLANAAPGINTEIGDMDLYSMKSRLPNREAIARGYDETPRLSNLNLLELVDDGSYDPIVTEKDIYHFVQSSLSSVIFRSETTLGPCTLHGFRPIDTHETSRHPLRSDIYVFSE